jgi:hypothetical protein
LLCTEKSLDDLCDIFDLTNIIKEPTCWYLCPIMYSCVW